jgi:Domain of unknown function (DUF5134)
MQVPGWLPDSFAAVMVAVSIYCSARLLAWRRLRWQVNLDINIAHVVMGVAMAGMLVPTLTTLPTGLWEMVFVGMGAWFLWKSARFVMRTVGGAARGQWHHVSHYLTHLTMSCAMLYMYLAAPAVGAASFGSMSMSAPSGPTANFVGLPLFFLIVLSVSAVWHTDSLSLVSSPAQPALVAAPGMSTGSPETGPATQGFRVDDPSFAPRVEMACHIAMCVTMGYMLILML